MIIHQNAITGTIGKTIKHLSMLYLIFLLSSCASFPSQSDIDMFIALEKTNLQQEISAYDLHKILTSHFGYVRIKLSDEVYALPDNDRVTQLLNRAYDHPSTYHMAAQGNWDRHDFAIASMMLLRNYAFGTMFITASNGDQYVINVFVNNQKEIVLWDSQKSQYYQGQIDKPELILL